VAIFRDNPFGICGARTTTYTGSDSHTGGIVSGLLISFPVRGRRQNQPRCSRQSSGPARALDGKRLHRDLSRDDGVDLIAGQDAALDQRFNQSLDNFNVCPDQRRPSASQCSIKAATAGDAATATLANASASI
jgi:hypothetical protein